jgi:hypothetical protein
MDLVEFLRARLDEDEHWAREAATGWPPEYGLRASEDPEHYAWMATDVTPSKASFIRRHDPARVLHEVEAKRALLRRYEDCRKYGGVPGNEHLDPDAFEDYVLLPIAAVYSGHPDYQQEWKP